MSEPKTIQAIVTTKHRGVFYGTVREEDVNAEHIRIDKVRMAIYWGTSKGVMQLAEEGPTTKSKISSEAPWCFLRDVTAVFACTDEAVEAWNSYLK